MYHRYKDGITPFAIIFMQAINRPPGNEYLRDVASFRAVCGNAFLPNVLLVATFETSPRRREEEEDRMLYQLRTDPRLWQPLIDHGAKQAKFDIRDPSSAERLLDNLPRKAPARPLHIQLEMEKEGNFKKTLARWIVVRGKHNWLCRFLYVLSARHCVCGGDN